MLAQDLPKGGMRTDWSVSRHMGKLSVFL
jgi:hypothetical protein